MRALLDARLGRRPTGIGEYTLRLAEQLTRLAADGDAAVAVAVTRRHRRLISAAGGAPLVVPARAPLARRAGSVDVVHGPNFHAPAFTGARRVATIHDLGYVALPDCHPPGMSERLDGIVRDSVAVTSLFICDSAYTRDAFSEHYGVEPDRCRVVHLGVGERFTPDVEESPARARGRPRPYLLHVGAMIRRKDLGTLMRAFERVAETEADIALVLAGNRTRRWASDWPTVRAWLREHPELRRRVRVLDYVRPGALPRLYREASAVVSTSLLEGFGLTALEALASGVPMVAIGGSAIEEIAGDVVYLSPARDAEAFADNVALALRADPVRRERGLQLARRFTWRRTAELTLDAYRAALSAELPG